MMFEQEFMVHGNSSDHLWSILIRLHVKLWTIWKKRKDAEVTHESMIPFDINNFNIFGFHK